MRVIFASTGLDPLTKRASPTFLQETLRRYPSKEEERPMSSLSLYGSAFEIFPRAVLSQSLFTILFSLNTG